MSEPWERLRFTHPATGLRTEPSFYSLDPPAPGGVFSGIAVVNEGAPETGGQLAYIEPPEVPPPARFPPGRGRTLVAEGPILTEEGGEAGAFRFDFTPETESANVGVLTLRPQYARRGFGTALHDLVVEVAEELGIRRLTICPADEGTADAIRTVGYAPAETSVDGLPPAWERLL